MTGLDPDREALGDRVNVDLTELSDITGQQPHLLPNFGQQQSTRLAVSRHNVDIMYDLLLDALPDVI